MNKNLLYGALIVIVIIAFTIIWKNSQKEETNGGVENQNPITETTTEETVKADTAEAITEDLNKINVDGGIDEDLKAIDTDIGTL